MNNPRLNQNPLFWLAFQAFFSSCFPLLITLLVAVAEVTPPLIAAVPLFVGGLAVSGATRAIPTALQMLELAPLALLDNIAPSLALAALVKAASRQIHPAPLALALSLLEMALVPLLMLPGDAFHRASAQLCALLVAVVGVVALAERQTLFAPLLATPSAPKLLAIYVASRACSLYYARWLAATRPRRPIDAAAAQTAAGACMVSLFMTIDLYMHSQSMFRSLDGTLAAVYEYAHTALRLMPLVYLALLGLFATTNHVLTLHHNALTQGRAVYLAAANALLAPATALCAAPLVATSLEPLSLLRALAAFGTPYGVLLFIQQDAKTTSRVPFYLKELKESEAEAEQTAAVTLEAPPPPPPVEPPTLMTMAAERS